MSETVPPPELLRSLGCLVRGLSALFWGLPLALVISVQTARTSVLAAGGIVPPMLAHALLLFGLFQIARFKPQERVWVHALDRTKLLALVNVGLSPFLFWHRMVPDEFIFELAVWILAISSLLFLLNLNRTLQRLAAMLPDETLRLETRLFTTVNLCLLLTALTGAGLWIAAQQFGWMNRLPLFAVLFIDRVGLVLLLLLVLLPVALSMTLLWRLKETILAGVFARAV